MNTATLSAAMLKLLEYFAAAVVIRIGWEVGAKVWGLL